MCFARRTASHEYPLVLPESGKMSRIAGKVERDAPVTRIVRLHRTNGVEFRQKARRGHSIFRPVLQGNDDRHAGRALGVDLLDNETSCLCCEDPEMPEGLQMDVVIMHICW